MNPIYSFARNCQLTFELSSGILPSPSDSEKKSSPVLSAVLAGCMLGEVGRLHAHLLHQGSSFSQRLLEGYSRIFTPRSILCITGVVALSTFLGDSFKQSPHYYTTLIQTSIKIFILALSLSNLFQAHLAVGVATGLGLAFSSLAHLAEKSGQSQLITFCKITSACSALLSLASATSHLEILFFIFMGFSRLPEKYSRSSLELADSKLRAWLNLPSAEEIEQEHQLPSDPDAVIQEILNTSFSDVEEVRNQYELNPSHLGINFCSETPLDKYHEEEKKLLKTLQLYRKWLLLRPFSAKTSWYADEHFPLFYVHQKGYGLARLISTISVIPIFLKDYNDYINTFLGGEALSEDWKTEFENLLQEIASHKKEDVPAGEALPQDPIDFAQYCLQKTENPDLQQGILEASPVQRQLIAFVLAGVLRKKDSGS